MQHSWGGICWFVILNETQTSIPAQGREHSFVLLLMEFFFFSSLSYFTIEKPLKKLVYTHTHTPPQTRVNASPVASRENISSAIPLFLRMNFTHKELDINKPHFISINKICVTFTMGPKEKERSHGVPDKSCLGYLARNTRAMHTHTHILSFLLGSLKTSEQWKNKEKCKQLGKCSSCAK